ncbi:ABC transporter permease [Rhodococcus pseudokoreensis]|uniref:ABC transporter permease n=1 Tax=Rhodococcus pseudokoreensis TaxID=2811421 RepID=A0A974W828_9NOCA|nr:ABC transporter permease [Rhodococcus pseudokoreensis]
MKNTAEAVDVLTAHPDQTPTAVEERPHDETVWLDEPRSGSSRWLHLAAIQLGRIGIVVAILAIWEFISGRWVDEFWISKPSAIWEVLWGWISSGDILIHLQTTLTEMLLGLVFGAVGGITVGFVLGRVEWLAQLLDPIVTAIYSLPKVALAPLFILWFGVDLASKVVLTAVVCFFLVFYNTYAGVRDVDKDLVDVVRVMGGRRSDLLLKVVLPSAAVWIYTGLRLAVPYALIGAVVGEIVASNKGLGFLLARAAGTFNTAGTFAALFILMLIGTLLNFMVDWSERITGRRTS